MVSTISFSSPFPCPPPQFAPPDVELLLIGDRCDLEAERAVESGRGEQFAWSQGIPFLETSAKTGHNIDEVRGHLVSLLITACFQRINTALK